MLFEVRQTEAFEGWLDGLSDPIAQKAIAKRIVRIAGGLFGDAKVLGDGVSELRIDTGPGYRAYYTLHGRTIIFLLCGGDKSTQRRDIGIAKTLAAQVCRDAEAMKDHTE